jgi:hypothetical protein
MKNHIFCVVIVAALLALNYSVEAQQHEKVPRIGFLSTASLSSLSPRLEAFRGGLREVGV